jgi:hypothetical protein
MKLVNINRAALVAIMTAGVAAAQNDECATAVALPPNTPTAFDTTIATLSPEPWTCAGSTAPDLWYTYTPTAGTVSATVETCGSGYDTALTVYDGTCGTLNQIACNDDFCALQSTIVFAVAPGTSYIVRVGGFGTASGTGTVTIFEQGPPPPPAPPVNLVDNLPGTWIDISATGTPLNLADDGEVNINTTIGNVVCPAGTVRVGSNGGVRFRGTAAELAFTNANIPSTTAFNGEQALLPFWDDFNTLSGTVGNIYWQETQGRLIIQWQDAGFFNTAASEVATFQVQVFGSGNIAAQFLYQNVSGARAANGGSATVGYQADDPANHIEWSFNNPVIMDGDVISIVAGAITIGTVYCNSNPNSTGVEGSIAGSGSAVVANNDLTLNASNLPLNSFGFFLTSDTQGMTPNPGNSQGILCLSGQIGRYVGPGQIKNSGATGSFSLLIDLNAIPTPGGFVAAVAGQTRNFQTWHRDLVAGVPTSNFTNAIAVTFQ